MIIVERTLLRVFRCVPERLIPFESYAQNYGGKWLHILGCDLNGKLWPIDKDNVDNTNITPTDVYVAKNCAEEVNEVYGLSMSLSQKIKLGIFIGICILILVVIFFLVSATGAK